MKTLSFFTALVTLVMTFFILAAFWEFVFMKSYPSFALFLPTWCDKAVIVIDGSLLGKTAQFIGKFVHG